MLDMTAPILAQIPQHFAEHPFQCVVAHFWHYLAICRRHSLVSVVAYIERRAV